MTLVEILIGSAAASLVLLTVTSLSLYSGRSIASLANYVDLDNYSRKALDRMSQQIRQTNRLLECTSTNLTFEDADGSRLSFVYDTTAKTLTRYKNGTADSQPLLKECDFLQFDIFQRNPVVGTYNQFPAATPATCKLVQLRWTCSRRVAGARINTESVQSAKIVIRKE